MEIKTTKERLKLNWSSRVFHNERLKLPGEIELFQKDNFYTNRRSIKDSGEVCFFAIADGKAEFYKSVADSASGTAIERCEKFFQTATFSDDKKIENSLYDLFNQANTAVFKKGTELAVDLGSTLTAALFHNNQFFVEHVGGSRVYRCRDNNLEQITVDQSLVIRPLETTSGPVGMNKVITRKLGSEDLSPPSYYHFDVQPGDMILLCSDGLPAVLLDKEIADVLATGRNVNIISDQLIDQARLRDVDEDVTVIVIEVKSKDGKKAGEIGENKPGKHKLPISMEKMARGAFAVIIILIVLAVGFLAIGEYIRKANNGRRKTGSRFTLESDVPIRSFFHNGVEKTEFLKNNRGFIRPKSENNSFMISPEGTYSISLLTDRPFDTKINFGIENIIIIEDRMINIWMESESTVEVKNFDSKSGKIRDTRILIGDMKGKIQVNTRTPVKFQIKIER
ncbi:MAG: protein phosphatase 2C domain-containing protein [Candidatus Eremiobacteraeota bacterium]|nr:protein phosphatase 2C domain-containing protein [Candidatus Eremiobacteraeota bacterium]